MQVSLSLTAFYAGFKGPMFKVCAWDHASEAVKHQVSQLHGFTDNMLACYEINLCHTLSLADAIVVDHAFGVGFAAMFVSDVYPWMYPSEQTKTNISFKKFVQSTLENARSSSGLFDQFTDESKT